MSDDLIVFTCGPSSPTCQCECRREPRGPCGHVWDGPDYLSEDKCLVSATCSRCGMTAFDHSMWTAP